jgi:hypothetical protein
VLCVPAADPLLILARELQSLILCRLTGWTPNGNRLQPGYEGYVHDSAPALVKMRRPGAEAGLKVAASSRAGDAGHVRV